MSTGFNIQHLPPSPFDGPNIKGDDYTFHVIVTDHPYMQELGLSAFTTGQLYEWASKVDKKDGRTYKNLAAFANGQLVKIQKKDPDKKLDPSVCAYILHPETDKVTTPNYYFSAWRENAALGGGEYVEQKDIGTRSNWIYKRFSFDELKFDDFDNAKVKIPDFESGATNVEIINRVDSSGNSVNNIDRTISNIIEMNDYVRMLKIAKPRTEWTETDKARSEFILDIKSSFEKCVTWSGIMPFRLNLGVATNTDPNDEVEDDSACIKREWVTFKLFLFDEKFSKEHARKVTMNELIFVSPKMDSFGRTGNKQNGEITPVSRGLRPQDNVAGVLDLQWNEFEGKWISGTPQVLAMMSVTAPAAKIPSLDFIRNASVKQLLTPGSQAVVTVGSAIPLTMQNGNPLQFSPEYKTTKDCRPESDINKNEVRVYNRFPRPWVSGEIVMLSKIDGVWQPSVVGDIIEEEEEEVVVEQLSQNWSFAYFMTNVNFFHKTWWDTDKDGLADLSEVKRFTYQDYEKAFRSAYYYNDSTQQNVVSGKWSELYKFGYGFFQLTSFDFMGPQIGGVNTANALGNTHIFFDSATNPITDGQSDPNPRRIYATKTAPFFGCVFPDGYRDSDGRITNYINGEYSTTPSCVFDGDLSQVPKVAGTASNWIYPIKRIDDGNPNTKDTIVFTNKNNTNKYSPGMFVAGGTDGTELLDGSLSHLPADIALNASPSGEYGSPIEIYDPTLFLDIDKEDVNYQRKINKYFQQRSYGAYRIWHGVQNEAIVDSGAYSFWDFEPNKPNRIQFRPLKMDLYAFREFREASDAQTYLNNANPFYTESNRGIWGAQLWETQWYPHRPIANWLHRIRSVGITEFDPDANFLHVRGSLIYSISGFLYNPDFKQAKDAGYSPTRNVEYNNSNGLNIPEGVWNKDWCLSPPRGAGAIGIIGAQYTVSSNTKISFETESLIGQPPVIRVTTGSTTVDNVPGNQPIINTTPGSTNWYDTWKNGDFHDSLNTTALWVRVFAAWPREQTYYDPRSFGVLHFNPFINGSYLDTRYGDQKNQSLDLHDHVYTWTSGITTKTKWIERGNSYIIIEKPNPPFPDGSLSPPENERGYPNAWYVNEVQLTDVDIRIPTTIGIGGVGRVGQNINRSGVMAQNGLIPLRSKKEEWNIDTQRRGKLLPYKGKFLTIGFGTSEKTQSAIYNPEIVLKHCTPQTRVNEQAVKLVDYDIFMINPGDGYVATPAVNYFTVEGGNGILIEAISEGNLISGPITKFRLANDYPLAVGNKNKNFTDTRGFDLMPDQFADPDAKNTDVRPLVLKLIPTGIQTIGAGGLEAYITRGILLQREFEDKAPEELEDSPWRLTPGPRPVSDHDITYAITNLSLDTTKDDGVSFTPQKISPNGQYDIFFRLHNDCSHTMSRTDRLGSYMNWSTQDAGPFENAVTVTINGQ